VEGSDAGVLIAGSAAHPRMLKCISNAKKILGADAPRFFIGILLFTLHAHRGINVE
jgi:hypothetical protein